MFFVISTVYYYTKKLDWTWVVIQTIAMIILKSLMHICNKNRTWCCCFANTRAQVSDDRWELENEFWNELQLWLLTMIIYTNEKFNDQCFTVIISGEYLKSVAFFWWHARNHYFCMKSTWMMKNWWKTSLISCRAHSFNSGNHALCWKENLKWGTNIFFRSHFIRFIETRKHNGDLHFFSQQIC